MCTDACKGGLGGVLSQNGFVICYESRKLKENENNYATHNLELAAIIHALGNGGITSWEGGLNSGQTIMV